MGERELLILAGKYVYVYLSLSFFAELSIGCCLFGCGGGGECDTLLLPEEEEVEEEEGRRRLDLVGDTLLLDEDFRRAESPVCEVEERVTPGLPRECVGERLMMLMAWEGGRATSDRSSLT